MPFEVAENQSMHIEGVLQQQPFVTIDNKNRSRGIIISFQASIIESHYEDINAVELCGLIRGDPIQTALFSMYRIGTRFTTKSVLTQSLSNI